MTWSLHCFIINRCWLIYKSVTDSGSCEVNQCPLLDLCRARVLWDWNSPIQEAECWLNEEQTSISLPWCPQRDTVLSSGSFCWSVVCTADELLHHGYSGFFMENRHMALKSWWYGMLCWTGSAVCWIGICFIRVTLDLEFVEKTQLDTGSACTIKAFLSQIL